jgi:hypothetical protein
MSTQATRDPSKVQKTIIKGGGIGIFITWIISQFFPGTDPLTQGAVTTAGITIFGAIGKELRNYVHSFEAGGDREGLDSQSLSVSLMRVLGDIFI